MNNSQPVAYKNLFKWALNYGLLMGLIGTAGYFLTNNLDPRSWVVHVTSIFSFLAAAFVIYFALKNYKQATGELSFREGFMLSLFISIISGLAISAVVLIYYWLSPEALKNFFVHQEATLKAKKTTSPAEIKKTMAFLHQFYPYIILSGALMGQMFIGLLTGMATAFILRDQETLAAKR